MGGRARYPGHHELDQQGFRRRDHLHGSRFQGEVRHILRRGRHGLDVRVRGQGRAAGRGLVDVWLGRVHGDCSLLDRGRVDPFQQEQDDDGVRGRGLDHGGRRRVDNALGRDDDSEYIGASLAVADPPVPRRITARDKGGYRIRSRNLGLKTFSGGIHPSDSKQLTNRNEIVEPTLPDRVVIPLRQSLGAPATPVVKVGDEVKVGTVIGEAAGFVSVPVHASISGKVTAVGRFPHPLGGEHQAIVIEGDGEDSWHESVAPR
ncbi:MAG: hypothetical protein KAS89_01860, partial [Candidatus Eisenbacteria sp.]|nr:hypothetical protein [Candidatus Eisenbacteria bacterium]